MASKVYLTYDQEELDRQLNLRARWPEHQEYFTRWAEESAAVRDRLKGWLDLQYGRTIRQTLDLFAPAQGAAGAPLLVFIHGGYWQALDKADFTYLAPAFLDSGIWFASLNYDLAPKARVPEMVWQVRAGIAWLYRHAQQFGFSKDRIYVAGHSAGAHLATMSLSADWVDQESLPIHPVKGVCSVSGVYDLEPVQLSYHNEILHLDREAVRGYSPLLCMPQQAAPLICAVGSTETEEFLRQQDAFVAAWEAGGRSVKVVELDGFNHFSAIDALGDSGHALFRETRDLALRQA